MTLREYLTLPSSKKVINSVSLHFSDYAPVCHDLLSCRPYLDGNITHNNYRGKTNTATIVIDNPDITKNIISKLNGKSLDEVDPFIFSIDELKLIIKINEKEKNGRIV